MQVANSTFLITGSSSGLGAATAQMIIDGGGNAVLADVNEEAGTAYADKLGERAVFAST